MKNKYLIIILVIVVFCVWAYLSAQKYKDNIKNHGVYTIAYIYDTWPAAKGGWYGYIYYHLYDNKYSKRCIVSYPKIGQRNYILVLPDIPDEFLFLEEKVPSWFTAEAPVEGWKTKPTDEELRAIQNKADSIKAINN